MPCCLVMLTWKMAIVTCTIIMITISIDDSYNSHWSVYYLCHHHHDHHHHAHNHTQEMSVGLWVLTGIVAFLLVEKLVCD